MKCKHIEVEGCIVNIRIGLSIEILPDDHYANEQIWKLHGTINNRVVQLKKKYK